MKIYTRTGDDGTTGLFASGRVKKFSSRISAYGDVDELNSIVGYVRTEGHSQIFGDVLESIQRLLFVLGADLATPLTASVTYDIPRIAHTDTLELERLIDRYETELSPLTQFILPGGSELASRLHIARTVSRRAEREVVKLSESENIGTAVVPFINRLSDLFFVMARFANHALGVAEPAWDGKR